MFSYLRSLPWQREPYRVAASFVMALGAGGIALVPVLLVARSIHHMGWTLPNALAAPLVIGAWLLIASPAILISTLPTAVWGIAILRHRFSSSRAADLGLGFFVSLVLAAFFVGPRWLLGAPTFADYLLAMSVFATSAAYFSVGFHAFRTLGGIAPGGSIPVRRSKARLATTTATETVLGVIALGWTGTAVAVLQIMLMIGPRD